MKIRLRFQAMQKLLLFVVLNFLFTSVLHAKTFVFLGDSLTEGYGVAQSASFPHLIKKKVSDDKLDWKIIGAGSSGSTSASALSRLKWIAKEKPDYVMILLGSNDGLRGFKVEEVEKNLAMALEWAQKSKQKVILGQLHVPPNYGASYARKFSEIYPRLAKKYKVDLAPFILESVVGKPELNLQDGVHPNEKGYQIIADKMYKYIKPYLK